MLVHTRTCGNSAVCRSECFASISPRVCDLHLFSAHKAGQCALSRPCKPPNLGALGICRLVSRAGAGGRGARAALRTVFFQAPLSRSLYHALKIERIDIRSPPSRAPEGLSSRLDTRGHEEASRWRPFPELALIEGNLAAPSPQAPRCHRRRPRHRCAGPMACCLECALLLQWRRRAACGNGTANSWHIFAGSV